MKTLTLAQVTIPLERIAVTETGCWEWNGSRTTEGYGILQLGGKRELRQFVHRVMYQLFVGPLNNNREIDHLCRNRACCNPSHLEAVSSRENSLRGNHPLFVAHREQRCRKGHDLSDSSNVYERDDGRVRCRTCTLEGQRRRRATRKEAV